MAQSFEPSPSTCSEASSSSKNQNSTEQLVQELAAHVNLRSGSALLMLQSLEFGDGGTESYKHYFEVPREETIAMAHPILQPVALRESLRSAAIATASSSIPVERSETEDVPLSRAEIGSKEPLRSFSDMAIPEAQEKEYILLVKEVVIEYCNTRAALTECKESDKRYGSTTSDIARDMVIKLRRVGEAFTNEADAPVEKVLSLIDLGHFIREKLEQLREDRHCDQSLLDAVNEGIPKAEHWRPIGKVEVSHAFDHVLMRYLGPRSELDIFAYRASANTLYHIFRLYGWGAVLFLPKMILDKMLHPDFWDLSQGFPVRVYQRESRPLWHATMLELSNWLEGGHELAFVDSALQRQARERLLPKLRKQAANVWRPGGENGRPLPRALRSSQAVSDHGAPVKKRRRLL